MNTIILHAAGIAAVLVVGFAADSFAHATLDVEQMPSGSYYKAVVNVPHGCDGSPTLKVRVQIPDGVTGVKPQPKAGWQVEIIRAKLDKPIDAGHGRMISETVRELVWTGRLADDNLEEFRIQMKLPDRPGQTVWFPIIQECEKGFNRWIEIPAAGKSSDDLKFPAPGVKLLPKP